MYIYRECLFCLVCRCLYVCEGDVIDLATYGTCMYIYMAMVHTYIQEYIHTFNSEMWVRETIRKGAIFGVGSNTVTDG